MKIAILDDIHPIIVETLAQYNCELIDHKTTSYESFKRVISDYDGILLRSRLKMNKDLLSQAQQLKFIGRPGAGLENIDLDYCTTNNIQVFRSPEGNMDAVGEHAIGMLFTLFNNLNKAINEVKQGVWLREDNRGIELKGKTVGILGYGYMGSTFAKKLSGFGVKTIAYDKYISGFGCDNVEEVTLDQLFEQTDILSIHTPLTAETIEMVNSDFITQFKKPIYIINTARGKSLVTQDVVELIKTGKVLGVCLDVLEYESSSFEFLEANNIPAPLNYLLNSPKAVITPHIAGWTHEAKYKMGKVLVEKIISAFF
ncbi:MAG: hydroxyacid dehydrogenase [Flavobacteriales bacterium]|jgi:D-3-phosphoglycerate dehydrogenase|nr:hydroxyacid dehydrogenase [Flavobacteriales bacterium]